MKKAALVLAFFLSIGKIVFAQTLIYSNSHQITTIGNGNGVVISFQYDSNGNLKRRSFKQSVICSGAKAAFLAEENVPGNTYQWQVDTGTGFINIIDDTIYSGTTTNLLSLNNPPTSWYGNVYHCLINGTGGTSIFNSDTLKFVAVWYGGRDNAWENPANWGCNKVPDENTDVIIYNNVVYYPIVNSNQSIRSLTGNQKSKLIVTTGNTLQITN